MPKEIHEVAELQELIDEGAQVVEVLPSGEYEEEHLPGATSIPLKNLNQETSGQLDPTRPIVVYCWDDA